MKLLWIFIWSSLKRRPGVFAAAFLLAICVSIMLTMLLFANMCESVNRIMPEITDEVVMILDGVVFWTLAVAAGFGLLMLCAPLIPICSGQSQTACSMVKFNVIALILGMLLFVVEIFLVIVVSEQSRIAALNLESRDKAAQEGKIAYERIPLPKFREHTWRFCGGKYSVQRRTDGTELFFLVDEKWKPDPQVERCWLRRVLLNDVMQWQEVAGRLHLLTEPGTRYVLDYAAGEVYKYPNVQHCPQSSQSDEVFENLERKLKNSEGRGNGNK